MRSWPCTAPTRTISRPWRRSHAGSGSRCSSRASPGGASCSRDRCRRWLPRSGPGSPNTTHPTVSTVGAPGGPAPRDLAPIVEAVLGLDDRPQAHPQIRARSSGTPHDAARSFTPPEVARLYNFRPRLDGRGQRIAVIELGGGYRRADLRSYFSDLGLEMPKITAVSVDGVRNQPGVHAHADSEVMLDLEVIGAIVPGAELLVYFAPLTDRGFVDAVTTAVFDEREPSVISISWGDRGVQLVRAGESRARSGVPGGCGARHLACAASPATTAGRTGSAAKRRSRRLPRVEPVRPRLRRHPPDGERPQPRRGRLEQRRQRDRRGREPVLPRPVVAAKVRVPHSHNPSRHRGRGVPDVAGNADPTPATGSGSTASSSLSAARAPSGRCGRR